MPRERQPVRPDSFTSGHQRSIGVALELLDDLIRNLRADGLNDESLSGLEAAVTEIADVTGAQRPRPEGNELGAKLAQMLVYALELDSRHLRAYGALPADAAAYLDEQSRRLSDLTTGLIDRTSSGQASPPT